MTDQHEKDQEPLGTQGVTAVDTAGQAVPADQLSHAARADVMREAWDLAISRARYFDLENTDEMPLHAVTVEDIQILQEELSDGTQVETVSPPLSEAVSPLPSARTLTDYRPQHDDECDSRRCKHCMGFYPRQVSHDDCDCAVVHGNNVCTCGLDALLKVESVPDSAQGHAVEDSERSAIKDPHWLPISTAPKDGTPFLASRPSERVDEDSWLVCHCIAYETNGHIWENDGTPLPFIPTHWMPLPAPPNPKETP